MGNNVLFVAAAIILGIGTVAYVGQRTLFESNRDQAEYQEQGLARDVAKSGLDRTVSEIKRKMMAVNSEENGVSASGGTYSSRVTPNVYGDLDVQIDAEQGGIQHVIDANVIFETPMAAAITLVAERVTANGVGDYTISGHDRRAPSRANTKGYLQPTTAVATNSQDNLRNIAVGLEKSRVIGGEGHGSWKKEEATPSFDALYDEAIGDATRTVLGGSVGGTYGSADNPAIVHVNGNFKPLLPFNGSGMLIVEDGHFEVDDNFSWEGIVMVRKNLVDSVNVSIGSGAKIFGSIIAYEASSGGSTVEECEEVPFVIDDLTTVPDVDVSMEFKVLGAAISYGGSYDMPVTTRLHIGDNTYDPWGSYNKAVTGNVNGDDEVPAYTPDFTIDAGTPVTISGRSWYRRSRTRGTRNSDWNTYLSQNSDQGGNQLKVLRDGDNVPNIQGYLGQESIAGFVAEFIGANGKIELAPNQSIYLFELGSTNKGSAAFDMQDLVVLVTMTAEGTITECTTSTVNPVLAFNINDGAEIHYSPESIAKLGKKIGSIRRASKVVVTENRSTTVTPEERHEEDGGGQYGGGGGDPVETVIGG